jgi:hypothetical protein
MLKKIAPIGDYKWKKFNHKTKWVSKRQNLDLKNLDR